MSLMARWLETESWFYLRYILFSFYYAHHISTIEGGMVCTNDESTYQYLRMIRSHGMLRESNSVSLQDSYLSKYPDLNEKFIFTFPGFNLRSNEISALIGLSQLERLDDIISSRRTNYEYFLSLMPDWIYTDFNLLGHSNYAFNVVLRDPCDQRMSALESALSTASIEYRRGSAGGGNQLRQPYMKCFSQPDHVLNPYGVPVCDHIHFYGLYIGNYPDLSKDDIRFLASVITDI